MNTPMRYATLGALAPALAIVAASPALEADRLARQIQETHAKAVFDGRHVHITYEATKLAKAKGIDPALVLGHYIVQGLSAMERMG